MSRQVPPIAQRTLRIAAKGAAACSAPACTLLAATLCALAFAPLRAQAGQLGAIGDMLERKAVSVAKEAIEEELKQPKPKTEILTEDEDQGGSVGSTLETPSRPKSALAPTNGWELVGATARLVNDLGESYTVSRVSNGYRFELRIPSAQPGELNEWSPNFQIADSPMTHVTFDYAMPVEYTATACRGRNLPDADACVASRQGKVDDHTIIQWVPTLREMPKLKDIFELLARGKPIEVDYLLLSERRVARFSTDGGADVRKILTH